MTDIYFQKGKASAYARTEEYIKALAEKGGYDIPDTKLSAGSRKRFTGRSCSAANRWAGTTK